MNEVNDEIEALREKCRALENANAQMQRINTALMDRVERDMDTLGSSFSLFQSAIVLESRVKERTGALTQVLATLELTNKELQASNQDALAASRAKSAFLATMSHELRTPMHGVLGMTELLIDTPLSAEQLEFAATIKRSAESLLTILNDILDFSKIEAGFMIAESTVFKPFEIVERVLETVRPLLNKKRLAVSVEWGNDVPASVVGDPTRFQQIVTNLVGNAVKFTEAGSIKLRAHVADINAATALIRIEVQDTGIGIAAEHLSGIFDSFTQSDSSITRNFGGTGLGLAIVRRMSELMGGSCGVESEVGRGSTFWFTVRIVIDAGSAGVPSTPVIATESPRKHIEIRTEQGVNALIVEDNRTNQLIARRSLETLGCNVQVASSGAEGVTLLTRAHEFAVVFMDCQMPGMDGLAATRLVRAYESERGLHVPIVALTANAMVGDRDACLAAGMDDFLSKPYQRADLRQLLERWCAMSVAVSE